MHPYLPHLLSDIAASHREEPSEIFTAYENEDLAFEKHFEEIDIWIRGEDPPHTFGYYCNLQSKNFPPPEQLANEDIREVYIAFKNMMHTWNLAMEVPDNLPLPIVYSLIVDILNTKTNIPTLGRMTFDFCSGYAPDCILKSYCPCLELWNEMDKDPLKDKPKNVEDTTSDSDG